MRLYRRRGNAAKTHLASSQSRLGYDGQASSKGGEKMRGANAAPGVQSDHLHAVGAGSFGGAWE
jgi:hypothetical protein